MDCNSWRIRTLEGARDHTAVKRQEGRTNQLAHIDLDTVAVLDCIGKKKGIAQNPMTLLTGVAPEVNRGRRDSLAVKCRKLAALVSFHAQCGWPLDRQGLGIPVDVSALVGYGGSAKPPPQALPMRPRASE